MKDSWQVLVIDELDLARKGSWLLVFGLERSKGIEGELAIL